MTFGVLVGMAAIVWLLSCGASLLAVYWNCRAGRSRRAPAFILSAIGLLTGYAGLSRIQLHASKTVNDHVVWSFNSRWFFIAALVVGSAALALTGWNWMKERTRVKKARENS